MPGQAPPETATWDFAPARTRRAPGVSSMVGYRAIGAPPSMHRGLPSSRLVFIVSLDEGVEAASDEPGLARAAPNPLVLSGLHLHASYVRQQRGQTGVQVALHPLAARAVLGVPAAELGTREFDGTAVLGRAGRRLHERLTETHRWSRSFALVNEFLASRYRDNARPRPELAHAWELLERSGGRIGVDALAHRVDLGPRRLRQLFDAELGRSPKTVAGLMRFERLTSTLAGAARQAGELDLAGIAVATGYSDQAHLTREFRRFTGTTPRRWLAEEFRNIQDGGHRAPAEWCHE